jgi:hypothetical protein
MRIVIEQNGNDVRVGFDEEAKGEELRVYGLLHAAGLQVEEYFRRRRADEERRRILVAQGIPEIPGVNLRG